MPRGKHSKHYRPKKLLWEYNLDGMSDHERIKGDDKKWLKKKRRLYEKKELKGLVDTTTQGELVDY